MMGGGNMGMGFNRGAGGGAGGMPGRLGEFEEEQLGKPYDSKVIGRLFKYVRPYKGTAIFALVCLLVFTGTVIAIPYLVRMGLDAVSDGDRDKLNLTAILFLVCTLIGWGASFLQQITMAKVTQSLLYDLRMHMFRHLHSLSMSFYDRNEVGRVMSRVQNDTLNLQEFLQQGLLSLSQLLSLFGIIVVLFFMDIRLALATLTVVPVLIICLTVWQRKARDAFIEVRRAISVVNANLNENMSGVRVVQSMNRQGENSTNFDKVNKHHRDSNFRAARLSALIMPLIEILMAISVATVIIYGGWRVLHAELAISVLVAFVLYVQRFFDPIRNLTIVYTQLQQAMASGARVFEFLDTPVELADATDAIELTTVKGDIKFEHVFHRYTPQLEVLHDIDLHISPGERIALVGETGAGKTTIASLIARLYDCKEGRVLIDDHDVKNVKLSSLTKHLAMVLQDPFLFSDTVRENIRYGRLDATDEEIVSAAKLVGVHDVIIHMEKGYDTVLSERGGNLSVGQRQLVSFARAVISDPHILILDEATANIDTYTEMLVQKALQKLLIGRTSVVIAHRLSTIRNADRIVALEHGRIQEIGSHDQLMAKGGIYARLYTMNYQLEMSGGLSGSAQNGHATPKTSQTKA